MNTDKRGNFRDSGLIKVPRRHNIHTSMDFKGCSRDNVFAQQLRNSVKCEHVYLHAGETAPEARTKLAVYVDF